MKRRPKIALLVNMVAPSRVRLYEHLATYFDLIVLHGNMEGNRSSWRENNVRGARVHRVAGWHFRLPKRERGKRVDSWFLHFEPGYLSVLFREMPDAVLTFEMGFRTCAALLYGLVMRKPVWVWWGGTVHTERNIGKLRTLTRKAIARMVKHWISYGQTSTEYLKMLGIPQECITQIQNCVDETWYREAVEPALTLEPKPVLLHVGQMIGRKGILEFLRAAAEVQRGGAKFSAVLVGTGPDAKNIRKIAKDLRLENIHFFPAQPASAMPSLYRSADVLVFPTLEDVWGLVANEAVLSGIPVLCSKYAGCAPELFNSDSVFDPLNHDEFVRMLQRAVEGELPRPDLGRLKDTEAVGNMIVDAVFASPALLKFASAAKGKPHRSGESICDASLTGN